MLNKEIYKRQIGDCQYWDITQLGVERLPFSIRIILESVLRNLDELKCTSEDVGNIMDYENSRGVREIQFIPARVILQDLSGIPVVVDLVGLRKKAEENGLNPSNVNP